jgi:UDP-MurNAc hydroxylase
MRLTWVNHASFLLEAAGVRLICDPWFEGAVFNNGWRLMSPTRMRYEDFATVTHIWFSHEHPDHFFPPNLKKIPEDLRRKITVLFHETRDKRVVNLCRSLGFSVQELPDRKRVTVGKDFTVICGINELIDSWIAIFAEGKTVLNLNDCIFPKRDELRQMRTEFGEVDLLLSQFSYANWVGNPGDLESHRAQALRKRGEMAAQIEALQPRQFIPFASYVYFCHQENFYMNQSVNRIGDIHRFLTDELHQETLVLYPGEEWEVGSQHESAEAIRKYEADFENALKAPALTSKRTSLTELQEAMSELAGKCREKNSPLLLRAMPPAVVRLTDLDEDVEVSFRAGIRQVHGQQPDVSISSESLLYCIKTGWGGETLMINGRYEAPPGGHAARFFRIFRVPQYNSYGTNVNLRFAAGKLVEAVRRQVAN